MAVIAAYASPLAAFAMLIIDYLVAVDMTVASTVIEKILKNLIITLFFCAAIYIFNAKLSFHTVAIVWGISFTALGLTGLAAIAVRYKGVFKASSCGVNPEPLTEETSAWYRSSIIMLLFSVIYEIGIVLDLYLIEIFGADEKDVGRYMAILTAGSFFSVLRFCASKYITPYISSYKESEERKLALQKKIMIINRFNVILTIIAFSAILIYKEQILGLFGAEYTQIQGPLMISAIGFAADGILGSQFNYLFYSGHEKYAIFAVSSGIIILLLAGIPLTLFWGLYGISIATSTVIVFYLAIMLVSCRRLLPDINTMKIF
jgi:O-antigen/teichoic acid export membrane protein